MPIANRFYLITVTICTLLATQMALAQASTELKPLPRFEHPDLKHASDLIENRQYQDAISELQELRSQDPQRKGVAHELGVAYYKLGDYGHASEALQQAFTENATDNEAVQLLGLAYYFSGKPKDAIPLLEKVQSWYPRANVDAAYVLGLCYIQSFDYEHARRAFAAMYAVSPDSAASHLFLARMLLRQGFDPIAEKEARQAIKLDPKLPMAHYLLGELYIFKSRISEAITELESELAINPGFGATYYRLADAYIRVMKFDDAERLLQRSMWLDQTASGPYILLGKVLLKKNEPDLAMRSLERGLGMDPNNYIAHYLMGQAYRMVGKSTEADRELQLSEKLQASQNRSQSEAR
jgi:tetratricopeptide (TPR) repeat protein